MADSQIAPEASIVALATRGALADLPSPEQAQAIRVAAGVSQRELARTLQVHEQTISKWERGLLVPSGSARDRYALFLSTAALSQQRRRTIMSSAFGLTSPVSYEPPRHYAGNTEIHEEDLVALLHQLKDEPIQLVKRSNVRSYGNPQEETRDRLSFLARRALVTKKSDEDWEQGSVVKITETYEITEAGLAAIGEGAVAS
jgi:transcriptional regulator with XRE-family HTH domain